MKCATRGGTLLRRRASDAAARKIVEYLLDSRNGDDVESRQSGLDLARVLFGNDRAAHAGLTRGVEFLDDAADGANFAGIESSPVTATSCGSGVLVIAE